MASSIASRASLIPPFTKRFTDVKGLMKRYNDVYYHEAVPPDEDGPAKPGTKKRLKRMIIYFHGDVQDYYQDMMKNPHKYVRRYAKWNLEDTAKLLAKRFYGHHIMIINAGDYYDYTIARHFNLVDCNQLGVPFFKANFGGMSHLRLMVRNVFDYLQGGEGGEGKIDPRIHWPEEIKLVGFSKGSTVLNQIIHELPYLERWMVERDFMSRLTHWYWVDAGHAGGRETYLTDDKVLSTFIRIIPKHAQFHVAVSPYQIEDDERPWIREEEKIFCSKLEALAPGRVHRKKHMEGEPRSLDNHFSMLKVF